MESYNIMNKIYLDIKKGKRKQYAHKDTRRDIEKYLQGFEDGYNRAMELNGKK